MPTRTRHILIRAPPTTRAGIAAAPAPRAQTHINRLKDARCAVPVRSTESQPRPLHLELPRPPMQLHERPP
jgi:hypothetical protein